MVETCLSGVPQQDSFPARFGGIHFVNQPWYIHALYTVIRPFLKDKTRKRVTRRRPRRVQPVCELRRSTRLPFFFSSFQIFMHGNNLNSLHQLIHPEILPSELGGMMPPYDMGTWARTLLDHAYDEETDYCPGSYTLSVQDLERDLEKNLSPKTMKRSVCWRARQFLHPPPRGAKFSQSDRSSPGPVCKTERGGPCSVLAAASRRQCQTVWLKQRNSHDVLMSFSCLLGLSRWLNPASWNDPTKSRARKTTCSRCSRWTKAHVCPARAQAPDTCTRRELVGKRWDANKGTVPETDGHTSQQWPTLFSIYLLVKCQLTRSVDVFQPSSRRRWAFPAVTAVTAADEEGFAFSRCSFFFSFGVCIVIYRYRLRKHRRAVQPPPTASLCSLSWPTCDRTQYF